MVHFAEINQAPPPYSMLQYIGRVATPKLVSPNCLRYLQTTLIMGGGGLVSKFYVRYCGFFGKNPHQVGMFKNGLQTWFLDFLRQPRH